MEYNEIQLIMVWAGYEPLTTKPNFTGNTWSNHKADGVIAEEDLSEWNAVKKLETKMIEDAGIENIEIIYGKNTGWGKYYDLDRSGEKYTTMGRGKSELDATLKAILNYVNNKVVKQ